MAFLRTNVCASLLFGMVAMGALENQLARSAEAIDGKTETLKSAIEAFNQQSRSRSDPKLCPELTLEEVVAAIRLTRREEYPEATDELFEQLRSIADTRHLVPAAAFDVLDLVDDGKRYVFDVWQIRLGLPTKDNGVYYFNIRKQVLRSRTLSEEAERLEKLLEETPAMPGRYRLEDRVKELRARSDALGTARVK